MNSVKHALRNAIVVSLQDAQNQRGKRFKSSRTNQRLKHQARRSCISRNGICSFTHRCKLNQDKVNSVKHTLRNAIVVSLQDAQNQRGKRFKSSRANQRLQTPSKKMQENHAYLEMGFDHLHTGANSTKTEWILSTMHSGTLSLSHCKMLRISGESVSNHHGQINDLNKKQKNIGKSCISRNGICSFIHWCKLNQEKVNSVKHTLRNAIVVSLQDAQNQRGKRFKSSRANQRLKHQARRCKKIMHISKWDLLIYTPMQTQPRQGEQCQACTQERYRCLTARCSESAGKAFQVITGISTTQTPSKKMQEDHAYLDMGFAHLHTGANSTKTK